MGGPGIFELLRGMATPSTDSIMKIITDLGSDMFYMAVVPVIYWCIDKGIGFHLAMITAVSSCLNVALKTVFQVPRPYVAYPHLDIPNRLTDTGPGWSFPSGHAQNSTAFWAYMSMLIKKPWFTAVSIIVVGMIAFTRVYMAVHYPIDVITGVAIGIGVVIAYTQATKAFAARAVPIGPRLAMAIGVPAFLFVVARVSPGLSYESSQALGFMMGVAAGYVLESALLGYDVKAPLGWQVFKVMFGLAVLMGLRVGIKAVLPSGALWNMVRYALLAVWATLGAPMTFQAFIGHSSKRSRTAHRS